MDTCEVGEGLMSLGTRSLYGDGAKEIDDDRKEGGLDIMIFHLPQVSIILVVDTLLLDLPIS